VPIPPRIGNCRNSGGSSTKNRLNTPPKRSACEWVWITAITGRSSTCRLMSCSEVRAVCSLVSGSMTIHPFAPRTKVILEMSYPRTCQMPSHTSNSPWCALSTACHQRFGLTVSGAGSPLRKKSKA